jgi:hypothetical protein
VHNARAHAAVLFSNPGLLSFNHWSAVPPPTLHNNTHWFTLLPAGEQDEIRRRLAAAPHSAVIFNLGELGRLRAGDVAIETPLARWLDEAYEPAFRVGDYEFRVPRGRRIVPVSVAAARVAGAGHTIAATIMLPPGRPVATIELHRFKGIKTERLTRWTAPGMAFTATSATEHTPAGFSRVEFPAPGFPIDLAPADGIIYFLDAAGRRLAEARLL